MQALGINDVYVHSKFDSSFSKFGILDSENSLLAEDKLREDKLGIYLHPGLTINNMTYRGYLEGPDVQDAICASFSKSKPQICKSIQEIAMDDIYNAILLQDKKLKAFTSTKDANLSEDNSKVRQVVMWTILGAICFVSLCLLNCYRMQK